MFQRGGALTFPIGCTRQVRYWYVTGTVHAWVRFSHKSTVPNIPKDVMPQSASPLKKSAPRPLDISDKYVFCTVSSSFPQVRQGAPFLAMPRETRSDAQKWFECDVFWTSENPSVSQLCYLFAQLHFLSSDAVSSIIFFLLFFSSPCLFSSSLFMPHSVESWTLELPFTIEVAVSVQVACSSTNWGAYVGKGRKQIP